jgi:DDE superfamily endonuclease
LASEPLTGKDGVLCADEKTSIQARCRCHPTLPAGKARMMRVEQVMTTEPYASADRVFWVVDNGSSHRGRASIDRMTATWPTAHLVHLPVHASWLDQIEIFYSILQVRVDQARTRPRLINLRVSSDPRASITTSVLRQVLIDQLLQAALNKASVPIEVLPDVHPSAFRAAGDLSDTAGVGPPPRPRGRGRQTPDERAHEAARIYSGAVTKGSRAPGIAVANEMG